MNTRAMAAVAVAILLSACGGGGGGGGGNSNTNTNTNTNTSVTSVKVVGASLADSGTFGFKFTVQPASGLTYQVYSELLASAYHVSSFCPAYTATSATTFSNAHPGCTNYAVASAKVNNYVLGSTDPVPVEDNPLSVIKQLVDVGSAGFTANDLLIVGEASSNDAEALAEGYINQLKMFGVYDFTEILTSQLTSTQITDNAGDPETLGILYMQALADKLVAAVKANALDKGAKRVAILNTLDVTKTPRFVAELARIEPSFDVATVNETATRVKTWIQAYNTRLAANVVQFGNSVVVVDLYTSFNDRIAAPSTKYGLTNTSATVCDEVVTIGAKTVYTAGNTSLLSPSVKSGCTDAAASALAPTPSGSDGTADWWKSYLFADNFHPTPKGHQLLSDIVVSRLTAVGWM